MESNESSVCFLSQVSKGGAMNTEHPSSGSKSIYICELRYDGNGKETVFKEHHTFEEEVK